MEIKGKRFLVIGGAGFIGSHVVSELLKHDVEEVVIYDNFAQRYLDIKNNAKEFTKVLENYD